MNGNSKNRIYLIGFFVILALPVLAASPWFHPAAWGKAIVFRIIISSLLFFIIWQLISKKTKINFKELLDRKSEVFLPLWLLVALWGVFLLATIFSLDPLYSFWESPFRAGGFLNFSFYIIFAILAFLILQKQNWQKIWDFSIFIAVLVSIIALFQQFKVFSNIIISYAGRPPSTMGGPTFLALYLVLLVFLTFSFLLKEKGLKKRLFYLFALLLFIYVILLTESRAVYFGLAIGFFYFILCYPKKNRLVSLLKILFLLLLIVGAYGVYYVNTHSKLPDYLFLNRLSIDLASAEPRFSTWLISIEAIKEKPLLGWGPENFSIAFDKHYDPSLPLITKDWGSWWDRAHNFLFDIAVTAGIPALIIFISLFAVLFWKLQRKKEKEPEESLICHGIQATFFGYLAANFFSFDTFSSYLISFLLIAYSLFLIQKNNRTTETRVSVDGLWRSGVTFVLFCILIAFIWFAGLKPLWLNKEINWADYYAGTDQCQKSIKKMEEEILSSQTVIDSYTKFKYIEIINKCSGKIPGLRLTLAPKVISILKEVAEIRPYYTRTWLFLGNFTNLLIENSSYLKIKNIEGLKKDAYSFFEKAKDLSPKREELFIGLVQTDLLSEKYQPAEEKAEHCVKLNPESSQCWWLKGLSNIYLENLEQADKDMAMAVKNKHNANSEKSILQLTKAYFKIIKETENQKYYVRLIELYLSLEQYQPAEKQAELCVSLNPRYSQCWWLKGLSNIYLENLEQTDKDLAMAAENKYDSNSKESILRLIEVYSELIKKTENQKYHERLINPYRKLILTDPDDYQYYYCLSHVYEKLGKYKKAKEEALIVIKLAPELKPEIEEYLKTFPPD